MTDNPHYVYVPRAELSYCADVAEAAADVIDAYRELHNYNPYGTSYYLRIAKLYATIEKLQTLDQEPRSEPLG